MRANQDALSHAPLSSRPPPYCNEKAFAHVENLLQQDGPIWLPSSGKMVVVCASRPPKVSKLFNVGTKPEALTQYERFHDAAAELDAGRGREKTVARALKTLMKTSRPSKRATRKK